MLGVMEDVLSRGTFPVLSQEKTHKKTILPYRLKFVVVRK